jgi:hypothetical protein
VVESPQEAHALVEIFLGEGRSRRDLAMEGAKSIEQLSAF